MATGINRLQAKTVAGAKYPHKPAKLFDGGGLFLHVQQSGKAWRLKYRHDGKEKLLALGTFPAVSLAKAREDAAKARSLIAAGTDPMALRKAAKTSKASGGNTFEAVARRWLATKTPTGDKSDAKKKLWSENTARMARRRLERLVFPVIGAKPIREVTAADLRGVRDLIAEEGHHETEARVIWLIKQVFGFAEDEQLVEATPKTPKATATKTTHRAAIIDPEKFAGLLRAIDGYNGQPATCAALRLLPLVFVRPGELRQAVWSEFDLNAATWRVAASRMKMRREHLVPLSRQAVAILRELEPLTGDRPFVFESVRPGRPLSENTLNAALRALGFDGETHVAHGFRAAARSMLRGELKEPVDVIRLQMAHLTTDPNGEAYDRADLWDERQRMMQRWSDYLDALRAGKQNVVKLRAGR